MAHLQMLIKSVCDYFVVLASVGCNKPKVQALQYHELRE